MLPQTSAIPNLALNLPVWFNFEEPARGRAGSSYLELLSRTANSLTSSQLPMYTPQYSIAQRKLTIMPLPAAKANLGQIRDKILPILLPYGIRRVALFGSAVSGEDSIAEMAI